MIDPEVQVLGTDQEIAWVIEDKDNTYIGAYDGCFSAEAGTTESCLGWVRGHENALRMSRKRDAETLRRICETSGIKFAPDSIGVSEHMWMN